MTQYRTSGPDGPRPVATATERGLRHGVGAGGVTPRIVSNDDLMRFVDGALDDDGRVRVLAHLASRPESVARVEAYLHQNARLRALREHLPLADSATFAAPLQAAIVESLSRKRRQRSWQRLAVAATVLVALASGVAGLALQQAREPKQTAATPAQVHFLVGQRDVGSAIDPDSALAQAPEVDFAAFAWLGDRAGDVTLSAPDLQRVGLELINGEVLDQQGSPAIRAVYRDVAGKPVVLFAGIGKPDVQHAFWLEREGYISLQWRRGTMIFALVAPTDSPQLSTIVDLVGAAVAAIVLPEQETLDAGAGDEPTLALPDEVEAAPAQIGPLQSIAVPAGPLGEPSGDLGAAAEPDAVNADTLPDTTDSNEPEAL